MTNRILAFKMMGGEEVVAEVVETKSGNQMSIGDGLFAGAITSYVLRRPHILQFQPIGNGQLGLAFVPWTLSNPDIEKIEVPVSLIGMVFDPSMNVERQYLQQTSGISLATSKSAGSRISLD